MNIQENRFISGYKNIMLENLRNNYPTLTIDELNYLIETAISKTYKNLKIKINNNYKEREADSTVEQIIEYIETNKPIMVENGCLFRQHKPGFTLFYNLIDSFVESRKRLKKEMFKYKKGTDEFNKYNLMQLLAKRDANAMYGYLGSKASSMFNLYVAVGITASGRALITHAISFFEQFFTNNLSFTSIDEVVLFIDRICKEEYKSNSSQWLDEDISLEDCFYKVISTCDDRWLVTDKFEKYSEIIWNILMNKSREELNRIYYKNNFFEFCNNSKVKELIAQILRELDTKPFMDPNEPPDDIKGSLDKFTNLVIDWCYMRYIIPDRFERISTMKRDISLITDTDSTIVSMDEWYLFVLSKVLENESIPLQENITSKVYEIEEESFDMITNETTISKREEIEYIGSDELRISIINILASVVSTILNTHFELIAEQFNTKTDLKTCLINMKNEFLFKRALLSSGKKNYAAIQELQEGNLVPKNSQLAITGLPIKKSSLKKSTQERLQDILRRYILDCKEVDQEKVISLLAKVEHDIYTDIRAGNKEFYKPVKIKSLASYNAPLRIQGIKAAMVYNAIKPETSEGIDLNARNALDVIKVKIDKTNIAPLKDSNPGAYEKLNIFFANNPEFKGEITAIGVPLDEKLPAWCLDFIDYKSIINSNLKVFPLEAINITRFEKDSINYTNVLSF